MRGCGDYGSRKWLAGTMMCALAARVTLLMSADTQTGGTRSAMTRLKKQTTMQEGGVAKFQAPPHAHEKANRTSTIADTAAMTTRTEHCGKDKQPKPPANKKGRLPNFLLAGAQKAGTTAIAHYFRRLAGKQVCFGRDPQTNKYQKEVHFFNRHGEELASIVDDRDLPIEQYRVHFRHCSQQQPIVMDATPNYLSWADQIHRVYQQACSDRTLRILLVLRAPIARELSWYHHLVFKSIHGHEGQHVDRVRAKENSGNNNSNNTNGTSMRFITFQESMETHTVPLIKSGDWRDSFSHYAPWIESWLRLFDRGQIWIASYDELKHEDSFLRKLHRFLNLTDLPVRKMPHSNTGELPSDLAKMLPPVPACDMQKSFVPFFEPYNQDLYQLLANHSEGAPAVETQPFPPFQFRCRDAW